MLWSRPPPKVRKPKDLKNKGELRLMGSVGQELHHLEKERAIQTDPEETRRRRTIQLRREDADTGSWGFTLQTYGIRNKRSRDVDVMTYVDYVELHGSAWVAGMRKGDVLLSVNGESVEGLNHSQLVEKIKLGKKTLRLVVLFEDCCRKVELYERYIRLKRILSQKMRDLKQLEFEEKMIQSGGRLSRVGMFRDSVRSSTSSDWDTYSEITSPSVLDRVAPNQSVWRQHFFARSTETLDNASELSFDYPSPFSSSRESLGDTSHGSSTHINASTDTAGSKGGDQPPAPAQPQHSAKDSDVEDTVSEPATKNFYIGKDGSESDSEVPTLRRQKQRSSTDPYQGTRGRSNSTILNDMRMILIADVVSSEAREASGEVVGSSNGEVDHSPALSDSRDDCDSGITLTVDENNMPCRLYRGVRINDTDQVTRL